MSIPLIFDAVLGSKNPGTFTVATTIRRGVLRSVLIAVHGAKHGVRDAESLSAGNG